MILNYLDLLTPAVVFVLARVCDCAAFAGEGALAVC